jgi:hypothetical protein
MRKLFLVGVAMAMFFTAGTALGQKDKDEEPTSWLYFTVIKEDNGKPVRNAAVVLHPVNVKGRQERGGLELKTSPEGKADFDGIPFGKLRVQVLARGFQTFGEDYEIDKSKTEITIKMKRPQGQYSVYDDAATAPKQDAPPSSPPPADAKKPN